VVPGLSDVVAIAPGFFALQADGALYRWNPAPQPAPQAVTGLAGAAVDLTEGWALLADGTLQEIGRPGGEGSGQNFADLLAGNGIVAASGSDRTTALNPVTHEALSTLVALRGDGTAWIADVAVDTGDDVPPRFFSQLGHLGGVQEVAVYGKQRALLAADGTVWELPDGDPNLPATELIHVEGLDDVRPPPSRASGPDFDLFAAGVVRIARGGGAEVPVTVVRAGGFTGAIDVSGPDLPPGLALAPLTLAATDTSATLHFTATAELQPVSAASYPVKLSGGGVTRTAYITFTTPAQVHMAHPSFALGYAGIALKADGTVVTWGSNAAGALGQGTTDSDPHPAAVAVPGVGEVVQVAAGDEHLLALEADGGVLAWGVNTAGQCGAASPQDLPSPTPVAGLPAMQAVAASGQVSFGLAVDGSVWRIGNPSAQLAPGPYAAIFTQAGSEAALVGITAGGATEGVGGSDCSVDVGRAVMGAGGPNRFLALRSDLTVAAKVYGACVAVEHPELTGAVALSGEAAVMGDGRVLTFGTANTGNGDGVPSGTTPVAVNGLAGAVDLATFGATSTASIDTTTLVLEGDGSLWGFGAGLGLGATPAPIAGATGLRVP
jgi:hypothetical protein